jgi:hypothetical protein
MKGVRLGSDLRGHRVEPVSWLRVTQDIPRVEYERFEPHACSNVSRSDDQSELADDRAGTSTTLDPNRRHLHPHDWFGFSVGSSLSALGA